MYLCYKAPDDPLFECLLPLLIGHGQGVREAVVAEPSKAKITKKLVVFSIKNSKNIFIFKNIIILS